MEEKEDVFEALKEMFSAHSRGCYPFDTDTFQHLLHLEVKQEEGKEKND